MTALALTADQRVLAFQFSVILAAFLVLLAVVAAVGGGAKPHQPVPPMRQLPPADDTLEECGRCGGAGVVDLHDDWARPLITDDECPVCGGTGVVEGTWA